LLCRRGYRSHGIHSAEGVTRVQESVLQGWIQETLNLFFRRGSSSLGICYEGTQELKNLVMEEGPQEYRRYRSPAVCYKLGYRSRATCSLGKDRGVDKSDTKEVI
jgi:hypothetical protein